MTASVEIVPATDGDLPLLYGLARGVFADLPGWDDGRVLDVMLRDLVFVARERAQAAGYVALAPDPSTESIVVDQLFVAPGHEERGIGHRLLEHAEGYAIAERVDSLRIVAEQSNWRARDFYRRSGFVSIEAELMELVLPHAN